MADLFKIGELRPSQLMHSFGIGAMIDFPNISAIVMGLDEWNPKYRKTPIQEDRLLYAVQNRLGPQVKYLYPPPVYMGDDAFSPEAKLTGIPVSTFPRWVRCPVCGRMCEVTDGAVRFHPELYRIDRTRYEHKLCPKAENPTMIPVRRLVACEKGHIDDFPWHYFVHGGKSDCPGPLFWLEFGVTGNPEETRIECRGCDAKKNLLAAFGEKGKENLPPKCNGNHPHLRREDPDCDSELKPIVLGASNSWFSMTLSVISLPVGGNELDQLVDEHWDKLKVAADMSAESLQIFRKNYDLSVFDKYSDDEIWEALQRRKGHGAPAEQSADNIGDLKSPEWQIFSSGEEVFRDPYMYMVSQDVPAGYENQILAIKQIHRLREAQALIGFTRLTSPGEFGDWDEHTMELRAPLSRTTQNWVPASEMLGEGIFIQFREEAIRSWLQKPEIKERENQFLSAHTEHRRMKKIEPPETNFPGIRFILLHSFSHALMRQLTLECGYSQAALRERVYARETGQTGGPMAGILIYTAAPDSEGTLGGLAGLAQTSELKRNLDALFSDLSLCSSDPHCSEHIPDPDGSSLHGAACHACLFAPETSCERGNKYLDRNLLVTTLSTGSLLFFP